MAKEINEECGVFGIFSEVTNEAIGYNTYLGLCSLQHRGEESCGIAINNNNFISCKKDVGLVSEVFRKEDINSFIGKMAIGQVKYSTAIEAKKENAGPVVVRFLNGNMAIAYNGNLINSNELKQELQEDGVIFQSSSDVEVICTLIARERIHSKTTEEAAIKTLTKLKGSYAFIIMTKRKMIAVRDPQGFKPLCMGKLNNDIVFSSETCAFDTIGATYERDIRPGEVFCISNEKVSSKIYKNEFKLASCIFEYIYFARPDSYIDGISVHQFRETAGMLLAENDYVKADVICGVPDSGLDAALGYSKKSAIPYDIAFIKNKYIGRTFIKPSQNKRKSLVNVKLNVLKNAVEGKKIVLVDDSIVRGTTIGNIIELLKKAGAKEVHVRISSPQFIDVCHFGTDIDNKKDLISNNMSIDEIKEHIGADSLAFLTLKQLEKLTKTCKIKGYCNGCFTSKYPINVPDEIKRDVYEQHV